MEELMATREFTADEARELGFRIGIDWTAARFDVEHFRLALAVSLEHGAHDPETDVTGDDPVITRSIAWAHVKELPDDYTRLEEMENVLMNE
jgi:hypothetical protein